MTNRCAGTLGVALVALVTCGGASLRSTQFRGPDGAPDWWSIACRGNNGACWREAGEVCPGGWILADKASHDDVQMKTVASGGSGFAVANTTTTTITNGELTIRCRGPSMAHSVVDPNCSGPENLRLPTCPKGDEPPSRSFLADDARERDAGR
jgi:hypothetical protein